MRRYWRALFRRNGRPLSMTSAWLAATGRQIDRAWPISGGMFMKLSIARPPLNPTAARAAKTSSQSQQPSPGVPRSLSERWMYLRKSRESRIPLAAPLLLDIHVIRVEMNEDVVPLQRARSSRPPASRY